MVRKPVIVSMYFFQLYVITSLQSTNCFFVTKRFFPRQNDFSRLKTISPVTKWVRPAAKRFFPAQNEIPRSKMGSPRFKTIFPASKRYPPRKIDFAPRQIDFSHGKSRSPKEKWVCTMANPFFPAQIAPSRGVL